MWHLIGVDVGSTDCKAVLIDTSGNVKGRSRVPYPTYRPQPGWAEQDPEDWYRAACAAIRACLRAAGVPSASVLAMSIDGPAHNVALMDEGWNVLRPTIHWSDLRSVSQAEALEAAHGEYVFKTTYSRVNPSWTLTQLLWLRDSEPTTWARLRRILVTKDYVRFRLTGSYETDLYDAIGTQLFDVEASSWATDLCDLVGFRREWLPTVRPADAVGGSLSRSAAADTGLTAGLGVAIGSGDSVVEAFGVGAIRPGDCVVKLGTAANVNLVTDSARPSRQSITYPHLVEQAWFSITATNSGTSTMRWFRDTFFHPESEQTGREGRGLLEHIEALAADVPPGCKGLLFHPYLSGERSPHWDPHLRGDYVGINASHALKHFARATLEGVAFSIRDCFDVIEGLSQRVERMYLLGGGANSPVWCRIVCDVLGRELRRPRIEDAAFGAAVLAGVAANVFDGWEDAAAVCAGTDEVLVPQSKDRATYDAVFGVYRSVTEGIRGPIHDLVRLTRETESSDESSTTERT
jgi:xylulokinase